MKLLLFTLAFLFTFALDNHAQSLSKKEIKELNVASITEWETDLRVRKPKAVQETFTRFNKEGDIIEIKEWDNTGLLILFEQYEYDPAGNKTVEIQYNADETVNKKHVYTYVGKLRTERKTYDAKGNLIGEKKYIYEYNQR